MMNDWLPREETLPHRRNRCSNALSGVLHIRGSLRHRIATVAICAGLLACWIPSPARAQSMPTASRLGDLQIGGGFVFARSGFNYTPIHLLGFGAYTTFAIRPHWGGEFDFHNVKASNDSTIYERTYEVGPRVFLTRGPLSPYAKVMYGRGVYNFSHNIANVAYNIYTFGGGADYHLTRSINLRADYEFQNWAGFPLGTLHPSVGTIGVAYHFHE
jgi:opacity protein-like surface antigen